MGLLDAIAGQVLGGGNGGAPGGGALFDAIGSLLNSQPGGLAGLVKAFEQQGLGEVIASWIGTGQNQAISGEQLQAVLGSEQVQALAQSLGFSPLQLSGQLAQMLPQVIDGMTPNGQLPPQDALGGLLGMLKTAIG